MFSGRVGMAGYLTGQVAEIDLTRSEPDWHLGVRVNCGYPQVATTLAFIRRLVRV